MVFVVPDLGEGLTDATITEWYVTEGEMVTLNQPLCILATAKAEVDIPSPFAGRVEELHGRTGDTVDVGAPLIDIQTVAEPGLAAPPSPSAPSSSPPNDIGSAVLVGYGTAPPPPRRDRTQIPPPQPGHQLPTAANNHRADSPAALAKPPVRALARRLGVDIDALAPGSGPNGIVTRNDVEAAGRARQGPAVDPPATAPVSSSAGFGPPPGASTTQPGPREFEVIPVRGVRAVIAQRMTVSRQTIPEAWCGLWVDATDLVQRVDRLRSSTEGPVATALTPFSLILRFVVAGLRRYPILNSTFDADAEEIHVYDAVHLGVAVAGERGLIVPVVRHAERRSTADLALETRRLITAVRDGSAKPAELAGSTFTVSNFGALGLDDGNPIINAPEAAILGVGAIRQRPAVFDGEIVARRTLKLTCAIDHRVCDGADAGGFLRHVARLIEEPDQAALDL